jgi:hypothetical protein
MTRCCQNPDGVLFFSEAEIQKQIDQGLSITETYPEMSQLGAHLAMSEAGWLEGVKFDFFVSNGAQDRRHKGNVVEMQVVPLAFSFPAGSVVSQVVSAFTGRLLQEYTANDRIMMVGISGDESANFQLSLSANTPFVIAAPVAVAAAVPRMADAGLATGADGASSVAVATLSMAGQASPPPPAQAPPQPPAPLALGPGPSEVTFIVAALRIGYFVSRKVDPRLQLRVVENGNRLAHLLSKKHHDHIALGAFVRSAAVILRLDIDADISHLQLCVSLPSLGKRVNELNAGEAMHPDCPRQWQYLLCGVKPFFTQTPDKATRLQIIHEADSYMKLGPPGDSMAHAADRARDLLRTCSEARETKLLPSCAQLARRSNTRTAVSPHQSRICAKHPS